MKPTQERRTDVEDSNLDEFADDDDSVFLQSSYKLPRKKLQANRRFLGVWHKSECNSDQIQEWLNLTAAVEMAKAGPIETVRPGKHDIGGFRRAHVSDKILFPMCCQSVLIRFSMLCAGLQVSKTGDGQRFYSRTV